jgi:hypothetical protein
MATLAVLVAAYALMLVAVPSVQPAFLQDRSRTMPLAVFFHLSASAVALLVGPLQFIARLRARSLGWHRWLGRAYVVSVLLGGGAGFALAFRSMGGLPAHLGFGFLAVLWLSATGMAWARIRAGDQRGHRMWMIRSYALTLAAVALRIYLPLSQIVGIPFEPAYQAISWCCWVPNLVVAEWFVLRHPPASGGRS